jgi:transcriptional regulator with XRE-family HTH domain
MRIYREVVNESLKLMAKKSKQEVEKSDLPLLSTAVRRVRAEYGDTLARFSQRLGISINSLSRFELNKSRPRDLTVLKRLREAASEKGLEAEVKLFRDAMPQGDPVQFSAPEPTLPQWRIGAAVRILTIYYPEHIPALIEALGPALKVVDAVLRDISTADQLDYDFLDRKVTRMADEQVFLEIQQELKPTKRGQ